MSLVNCKIFLLPSYFVKLSFFHHFHIIFKVYIPIISLQKAFVKIQHFLPRVRFVICEFLQLCMYKRGVRAPHINQGRVWCFTARVLTAPTVRYDRSWYDHR